VAAATTDLIVVAVQRVQAEVPALAKLRLVFGLELTNVALTGPGESEHFRVELPGPKISDGEPEDGRITLTIPKTMFKLLAEEGQLVDWREAFYFGHLKVGGDTRVKRLLGKALRDKN
jgi:hypothetical protein